MKIKTAEFVEIIFKKEKNMSIYKLEHVRQRILPNEIVLPLSRNKIIGYYQTEPEAISMIVTLSPNALVESKLWSPIASGEGDYGPWKAFSIPFKSEDAVDLYTITELKGEK